MMSIFHWISFTDIIIVSWSSGGDVVVQEQQYESVWFDVWFLVLQCMTLTHKITVSLQPDPYASL